MHTLVFGQISADLWHRSALFPQGFETQFDSPNYHGKIFGLSLNCLCFILGSLWCTTQLCEWNWSLWQCSTCRASTWWTSTTHCPTPTRACTTTCLLTPGGPRRNFSCCSRPRIYAAAGICAHGLWPQYGQDELHTHIQPVLFVW